MYVESLALENYRNYAHLSVNLSPGINIFFGDNAQGKTNVLEALYMCATTKSHRGSRDREIIRFGEEEAHIRMLLSKEHVRHKIGRDDAFSISNYVSWIKFIYIIFPITTKL